MKKLIALFCLLAFVIGAQAQRKVSLQDVAQGTYRAQSIYGIKPMLDGEHYTQMSSDKKRIVKYSFKTGKEVELPRKVVRRLYHVARRKADSDSDRHETHLPSFVHCRVLHIQREKQQDGTAF